MLFSSIYAEEPSESLGLDEYVNVMDEHIRQSELGDVFNVKEITQDLLQGKGIEYSNIIGKLLNIFLKEVFIALKGAISIIIILVLISLLKSLEIDERKRDNTNFKFCLFFKFIYNNDYDIFTYNYKF